MRVLLFDPLVSGHHIEYATYLARCLQEAGDQVGFVAWRPHPLLAPLTEAGAELYYAAPNAARPVGGSSLTRLRQIAHAFDRTLTGAGRDGFDVVHNLYVDRSELATAWTIHRHPALRVAIFATLFWPYFVHTPGDGSSRVKRLLHALPGKALGRMLTREALHGLFVHTEDSRDVLLRAFGNSALANRIHVVPDPATMPPADLTKEQARRLLGLPLDRPLVLFFGGLRWDKGYDVLLQAAPLLGDGVGVVLAGEADWRVAAEVEETSRHLACSQRLESRLTRVDDEDVARYFVAADLVVMPYRRVYVGTSGVLQRAAGAGRPVVAADVGQIGPIVRRHGLGVVCPPEEPEALAQAISHVLRQDEAWREEVRNRAREYAQNQGWRVFGAQVRAVYAWARRAQPTECES